MKDPFQKSKEKKFIIILAVILVLIIVIGAIFYFKIYSFIMPASIYCEMKAWEGCPESRCKECEYLRTPHPECENVPNKMGCLLNADLNFSWPTPICVPKSKSGEIKIDNHIYYCE